MLIFPIFGEFDNMDAIVSLKLLFLSLNCREGSVIADVDLNFAGSATDVTPDLLRNQFTQSGQMGNLTYDPQALLLSGFCNFQPRIFWLVYVISVTSSYNTAQNFTVALEASLLGQLFIFRTIFQPWVLSSAILASRKGVYLADKSRFGAE